MNSLTDPKDLYPYQFGMRAAREVEVIGKVPYLRDIVVTRHDVTWVRVKNGIKFVDVDGSILENGKDLELFVTVGSIDPWHLVTERPK